MKKLIYHIMIRTLGILLAVLAVAPAMAQKPVPHFVVDQCDAYEFSVVDMPGDRYTWDLYRDSTVNFAWEKGDVEPVLYFEDAMYEGSTVRVNFLEPGRYFLRVMAWDEVECTNNLMVFLIDVEEAIPEAELYGDSVCIGEPSELKLILTGRGPWDVVISYDNGNTTINLNGITEPEYTVPAPTLPVGINEFWVSQIIDQCTMSIIAPEDIQKAKVLIYPKPVNSRIFVKDE